MRTTPAAALLALAAGSLAFTPVAVEDGAKASCTVIRGAETTDDTSDDVEACRQDVWFHGGDTPVDNLDEAAGLAYPTWDTTPPDASVTAGAGGGKLTNSVFHQQVAPFDPQGSFVAAGEFEGAIDDVIVELYLFTPGTNVDDPQDPVVRGDFSVDAQLLVDGSPVGTIADRVVSLEPAGDAVQRVTFAFRDVAPTIELFGLPLEGAHDVEVRVHGLAIISDAAVVVYDTTEVPGGLVFNPPSELLAEVD